MKSGKSNAQKLRRIITAMLSTQSIFLVVILYLTWGSEWQYNYSGGLTLPITSIILLSAIFLAPRFLHKQVEAINGLSEGPTKWDRYSKAVVKTFMLLQFSNFIITFSMLFETHILQIFFWLLIVITEIRLYPNASRVKREYRSDWA